MPLVTTDDVVRMRDQLFFEGEARARRLSRFWLLLCLAAVIAAAGVVGDSTATVIGAMIVAPLMTPILGTVLAVVLLDRPNLVRSIALVVAGAAAVIAIGWVMGLLVAPHISAEVNTQVAARIHPRLIDLVAALATGAVGAGHWPGRTSRTRSPASPSPSRWSRPSQSSASPSSPARPRRPPAPSCSSARTSPPSSSAAWW